MRALLSVTDKNGLGEFGKGLAELGFELVASGGTARALAESGCRVLEVEEITGFPEILGGRVKTLHPRIFAAILADRDEADHCADLERHEVEAFDLVVVNLYRFREAAARPGASLGQVVEAIDIGGPSLIRAAAKNHKHTLIVVDPEDYGEVLRALSEGGGTVTESFRRRFAAKAFAQTAAYDREIEAYFAAILEEMDAGKFPSARSVSLEKQMDLRYGENPHQAAALYRTRDLGLASMRQLHGKELSYNNILDLEAAAALAFELGPKSVALIKHTNPCGAARAQSLRASFDRALATDPVSAFGGIAAFSGVVDAEAARAAANIFLEVVIAQGYSPEALDLLRKKKNLRLIELDEGAWKAGIESSLSLRDVGGLILIQERDHDFPEWKDARCVTRREPTGEERKALELAWKVCKHVKSNAIVIGDAAGTLGVGAGQMSRVDAARIAVEHSVRHGHDLVGSSAASDAFFPFADGIEELAKSGIRSVVQPGGSKRDEEVIAAANASGMSMIFTGRRHFRH